MKPAHTHVELVAVLRPRDPADLNGPEDLTDEADEKLVTALENAGFHVVEYRIREGS